jgi:NDP-sugar pyrophosphorylase family protein
MVLRKSPSEGLYGRVMMDQEGQILQIRPKGMSQAEGEGYVFTGLHLLEPEVLQTIPPDVPYEINQMVYPRLIREGREVRGFLTDSFWAEIGSHETYLQAHRSHLSRRSADIVGESSFTGRVEFTAPVLMGAGSEVEVGAQIGPMAVVGHHCRIGHGAVIEDSVIWDDVVVGCRAHIRSSIVGHRTHIDPETHIEGMVACGFERKKIG